MLKKKFSDNWHEVCLSTLSHAALDNHWFGERTRFSPQPDMPQKRETTAVDEAPEGAAMSGHFPSKTFNPSSDKSNRLQLQPASSSWMTHSPPLSSDGLAHCRRSTA